MLLLLSFARLCMAMQLQSVPPVTPFLVEELGLSYTQIGALIGLFVAPGFFLAVPGGLLASRLGDKRMQVASLALLLAGTLGFAHSTSFAGAVVARLVAGTGAVTLTVQQPKLVTDWFAGHRMAMAMAVLVASYPLGIALALATLGAIAEAASWRVAIYATAAVTAAALALLWAFYREAPGVRPPAKSAPTVRSLWRLDARQTVLALAAGGLWMLLNTAFIVFMSFTPGLLLERGYAVARSGVLASVASWLSLLSVPLGGFLTDLTGRKNLFIVLMAVAAATTMAGLPLAAVPALWIVAFGLVRGLGSGAIMSLPGEVLPPEGRALGFALYFTVYYAGMALVPPLAGALQDATGTAAAAVWFGALLWLLIAFALAGFRALQRRWQPAAGTG